MLEVVENWRFLPVEPLLSLEHTSNQVFPVIVEAFADIIYVNASATIFAVEQILKIPNQQRTLRLVHHNFTSLKIVVAYRSRPLVESFQFVLYDLRSLSANM